MPQSKNLPVQYTAISEELAAMRLELANAISAINTSASRLPDVDGLHTRLHDCCTQYGELLTKLLECVSDAAVPSPQPRLMHRSMHRGPVCSSRSNPATWTVRSKLVTSEGAS